MFAALAKKGSPARGTEMTGMDNEIYITQPVRSDVRPEGRQGRAHIASIGEGQASAEAWIGKTCETVAGGASSPVGCRTFRNQEASGRS